VPPTGILLGGAENLLGLLLRCSPKKVLDVLKMSEYCKYYMIAQVDRAFIIARE